MSVNSVASTQQITQLHPHRQGGRMHETGTPGRPSSPADALGASVPTAAGVPFQKLANDLQSTLLQLQGAGNAGPVSMNQSVTTQAPQDAPKTVLGDMLQALQSYVSGKPATATGALQVSA